MSVGPIVANDRPGSVVFPGDVDGDGRDDAVWACGDAVCTVDGVVADGILAGLSVTDPRFPPVLSAGSTDVDGRALLWIGGSLRTIDGEPVARLALPPAVAGFDADRDGATDVLSVAPGGRVVLAFGPFDGAVRNDPDAPGFDIHHTVVYDTGGDSVAHRVWWVPDAYGPGAGAVAAQCADDERIGSCPSDHQTVWWPVLPAQSRVGADRADGDGGRVLLPAGDLDGDGLSDLLTDDGAGGWRRVRGARIAARGPVVAIPGGWVTVGAKGLQVARADGAVCLRFDLPLAPDTLSVGHAGNGWMIAVTGRIGDRWGVVGVDRSLVEDVCGL